MTVGARASDVVYRKGDLSKGTIDRDWPHQVALPAARCLGGNYVTIRLFCDCCGLRQMSVSEIE